MHRRIPILANPTISEWFNTSAFAQPAPFTWGNAPRTMAHATAPGLANWDLAVEKWWNFTETAKLEFRAEMFNALNHTNFAPPNQTFGDPSFGTITTAAPARDIQLALKLYW